MDREEFAKLLMAGDRIKWQNPGEIFDQINFPKDATVVDLGCGPGYFVIPLLEKIRKDGRIYAVDADPVMLSHLEANLQAGPAESKVVITETDVTNTKLPEGCADIILFANLLHDLKDHRAFFEEVKRILKPNGQIIDIDWQKSETDEIGPPAERRLSENDSRKIIRSNGFRIAYALNAGPYHYGFVCQRVEKRESAGGGI